MADDHERRLAEIEAELKRREERAKEVLKQFATLGGLIVLAFILILFSPSLMRFFFGG